MFGKNPIRKFDAYPNGDLQVHEIFFTLQGEGPHSGLPAVFVRLSGCNLSCWWCDTHWDDQKDPLRSVQSILEGVALASRGLTQLIVLTGGEPLRQDLRVLLDTLARINFSLGDKPWKLQIETAGTLWQECLDDHPWVDVVCSPKTAAIHPKIKARANAFKYVINARDSFDVDGLPITNTQIEDGRRRSLAKPRAGAPVYLSPCDLHEDKYGTEANYAKVAELSLQHGYRAGVQLHKVLGLP